MNLFKPAWKGLIDLLDSLPIDTNAELIPIILPYLHKIHDFAEKSSPTSSMLKFINIILGPINRNKFIYEYPVPKIYKKLTSFLLSFILRFVKWVPHNLNEEAFKVLDSILHIVRFNLKYKHIEAITLALLDKYTMRSKIHKKTMKTFISLLIDQDRYEEINGYESRQNYID